MPSDKKKIEQAFKESIKVRLEQVEKISDMISDLKNYKSCPLCSLVARYCIDCGAQILQTCKMYLSLCNALQGHIQHLKSWLKEQLEKMG